MDDLQIVRDFCAEEAPPGQRQLAALRTRVVAGFGSAPPRRARGRAARSPASRRRGLGWPRLALVSAVAAVLAGAVTAVLVIPSAPGGPAAGHQGSGVRLDAALVLHRAARAALAAPLPGNHPFIYTETVVDSNVSIYPGDVDPSHRWRQVREAKGWISVSGRRPGTQYSAPCHTVIAPTQRPWCLGLIPVASPLGSANAAFTYTELQHAPTAPQALLGYLEREQEAPCRSQMAPAVVLTRDQKEWSGIATVLADVPVLPPHFGAALFDAAAQIPGISVMRITTLDGRPAIAVVQAEHFSGRTPRPYTYTFRTEFVFSASTYRYIGMASLTQAPGGPQYGYVTVPVSTGYADAAPPPDQGVNAPLQRCAGPLARGGFFLFGP